MVIRLDQRVGFMPDQGERLRHAGPDNRQPITDNRKNFSTHNVCQPIAAATLPAHSSLFPTAHSSNSRDSRLSGWMPRLLRIRLSATSGSSPCSRVRRAKRRKASGS